MSTKDDGGPAFPPQVVTNAHGEHVEASAYGLQSGMSLRDYAAIKFAASFCMPPDCGMNPVSGKDADWKQATARIAYEMADAMLEARKA